MKKIILIILYCGLCLHQYAQKNKIDSLLTLLQTAKDTAKVTVMNEMTKSLWYYQLEQANEYNLKALHLADSISFQKGLAEANRCRGVILTFKKDPAALSYLEKALTMFRKLNNKRGIAATLNNQSGLYNNNNESSRALDVATQSLKLFEELNDTEAIGAVINQIGFIYEQQSDFTAALAHYLKALAIRQKIGDNPGTAFSLTRVGDMYAKLNQLPQALDYYQQAYKLTQTLGRNQNLVNVSIAIGDLFKRQGNYKEALNYYIISFKAEEDFSGKDGVSKSCQRLGEIYLLQKKYDLALENFQKALNIVNTKDKSQSPPILYFIAKVFYEEHNYVKALEYANSSLEMARKSKKYASVKDASFMLSQIYGAMNDYTKAYQYQLLYDGAKDSVLNEDLNMRLASLQQSFEIRNRQTQIDLLSRDKKLKESELNRQKQQRYAFIVGIFLFLVLAIVLARNNRHKQKANILLQHQKEKVENTLAELKTTQTQLIQSEKMASLGELTAGIAHEIQNPLNFVNNFSEVNTELIDEMKNELTKSNSQQAIAIANDIKENEQKINYHGKRADAIVKGMLQHSRASSNKKEPTDINALADEYLRLSYHGLRAKDKSFNATMQTHFDDEIGMVDIVSQDMGRVLLNLFTNAFYSVAEKKKQQMEGYQPTVTVTTKKLIDKISISVKDNGVGIPQKVIDKIYQPFFTTKPAGQGTGLGLSLSYDIITKAHGGKLEVTSKEGEGAEFIISLPA